MQKILRFPYRITSRNFWAVLYLIKTCSNIASSSDRTVQSLGILTGAQLFSLNKEELRTVSPEEGVKVYSQIMVQKALLEVCVFVVIPGCLCPGEHSHYGYSAAIFLREKKRPGCK